jgi:hypothetical protein
VTADLQSAAARIGRRLEVFLAGTNRDIDTAFEAVVEKKVGALVVGAGPFFTNRRAQLVTLAARYAVPAIYSDRDIAEAGGLMSYASNVTDQYRQTGLYTGRILKGEKPADLPVMQPTRFEFVINLQIARLLRIDIPPTLLAIADEVIDKLPDQPFSLRFDLLALARRGCGVAAGGEGAAARASRPADRHTPYLQPRTMRNIRPASGHSYRGFSNRAGPSTMRGLTRAGPQPMPPLFADTRPNWSHWHPMSSSGLCARPWGHCCRRPAPCRLCSRSSAIRSAPALSTAWRGRRRHRLHDFQFSLSGKWLELLKQIAPGMTRVAVIRDATQGSETASSPPSGRGTVAQGEVTPDNMRDAGDRGAIAALRAPNGGDRGIGRGRDASSRSDHHAGGWHKATRGLLRTFFVPPAAVCYGPNHVDQLRPPPPGQPHPQWRKPADLGRQNRPSTRPCST